LLDRDPVFRLTLRYTVQAAALAPLIYLAVARSRQWPFRWLNSRPLVYLGSVSYTIYLVHHMVLLALHRLWPQSNEVLAAIGGALLTLVAAELMRRSVDVPFARLRRRLHRRWIVAPRPVAPLAALSR
jgi:peptidoglycan/LPS O-acetylase OafA/YrhL